FNGAWRDRFDVAHTHDAPFLSGSGAPVPALLMTQAATFRYTESADVQAVELPYGNGAFVMTVLLPKPGRTLATLVNELDAARWDGIVGAMRAQEVELFLPKLQLREHSLLNDALAAMGMEPALCSGGGADFSRLSPLGRSLCISHVLHDTFVDVHEEGTEAAAVTTVVVGIVSAPVRPTMRVDRPYLFAVRERFSGTILFMGAISSP
ncbi:MAG TPA: serpin family protein, partial [Gemmatimonadaceae bacterium]|nr:serpin family protein [Gemmatimonadaceae bacterium]